MLAAAQICVNTLHVSDIDSFHFSINPVKIARMGVFGQNLRRAREAAGLTQEELAELMPYQRENLSSIETGKKSPSAEVIAKLASVAALGLHEDELVAWKALDYFGARIAPYIMSWAVQEGLSDAALLAALVELSARSDHHLQGPQVFSDTLPT